MRDCPSCSGDTLIALLLIHMHEPPGGRSRSLHLVQTQRLEHRDTALYWCKARLDEGDPMRFPGALKETEAAFNVQEELSEFGFDGMERRS